MWPPLGRLRVRRWRGWLHTLQYLHLLASWAEILGVPCNMVEVLP